MQYRAALLHLCAAIALGLPQLAAAKELTVTQVVALSGSQGSVGKHLQFGIALYLDAVNARGGARLFGVTGDAAGRDLVPANCA